MARKSIKIGYARVSTPDQNPDVQISALKAWGCDQIFVEAITGTRINRPELDKVFTRLETGDTLVVWSLSRLRRSVKDMVNVVSWLDSQAIRIVVTQQNLDTRTAAGRLLFHITAAFDEFQREVIVENTPEGLAAARAKGVRLGRPPTLTAEQIAVAFMNHM